MGRKILLNKTAQNREVLQGKTGKTGRKQQDNQINTMENVRMEIVYELRHNYELKLKIKSTKGSKITAD